jgi:hypothetical protein
VRKYRPNCFPAPEWDCRKGNSPTTLSAASNRRALLSADPCNSRSSDISDQQPDEIQPHATQLVHYAFAHISQQLILLLSNERDRSPRALGGVDCSATGSGPAKDGNSGSSSVYWHARCMQVLAERCSKSTIRQTACSQLPLSGEKPAIPIDNPCLLPPSFAIRSPAATRRLQQQVVCTNVRVRVLLNAILLK